MSARALLLAVRDTLRADAPVGFALTVQECRLSFDGKPTAVVGDWFVAVHMNGWSTPADGSPMENLDESYGTRITVSHRMTRVPEDRFEDELLRYDATLRQTGLYDFCERIRVLISMNYAIKNLANSYIPGTAEYIAANSLSSQPFANGLDQPLCFRSAGDPVRRAGSWWSAKGEPNAGCSITLEFDSARRTQTIENQT